MKGGECTDASGNPQLPTEDYSNPIQLSNLLDLTPGQDGRALQYASPELQNDPEVIAAARQ